MKMAKSEEKILNLPIIDLSSPDRLSSAASIRQACIEFGFFLVVNHGVDTDMIRRLFDESSKFFSLPIEEKMKLSRKEHRGYTALYSEKLDPTSGSKVLCTVVIKFESAERTFLRVGVQWSAWPFPV